MDSDEARLDSEPESDARVGAYEIPANGKHRAPKRGGQGRVCFARCVQASEGVQPGEEVALKEMLVPFEGERQLARAHRTVELLKNHPHPSIVKYHEFLVLKPDSFFERQYIVMEYLNGCTLAKHIALHPKGMDWEEVRRIFSACLDALRHARSLGIIHRDVKPSNIFLVEPHGDAKLIDFEIARHETEFQSTRTGLHGSFDYMAPECHPAYAPQKGFSGDESSDIYSLTTCLYEALIGKLPYGYKQGADLNDYSERCKHTEQHEPHIPQRTSELLEGIKSFLIKGLAHDRNKRFLTFDEMAKAFSAIRRKQVRDGNEKYELIEWIGQGGFAHVFRARRESDGLQVALKCLKRAQYAPQFIKEARLLAHCNHPNIVRSFNLFRLVEVEQYFIVLEYLEGMPNTTLGGRIRNAPDGMPLQEVLYLFRSYASGLYALHHDYNIIHRDIKPSNLYAPEGRPENGKLLDLGVARDLAGTKSVGAVPGTFDYMAPEIGRKRARGSAQSDIYSLGLCFYEALTGRPALPPLPRDNPGVKFIERCKRPARIDYSHPVFSEWTALRQVVERALAYDPRRRYATVIDFGHDLDKILGREEAVPITANLETTALSDPDTVSTQVPQTAQTRAVPQPHRLGRFRSKRRAHLGRADTVVTEATHGSFTQLTRALAGERAGAIKRRMRPIAKGALWLFSVMLLALAVGYALLVWGIHVQRARLSEGANVDPVELTRVLASAIRWSEWLAWMPNLVMGQTGLNSQIETERESLKRAVEFALEREPLDSWKTRLEEMENLLLSKDALLVLGEELHGKYQRLMSVAWAEADKLKGLIVVRANVGDWLDSDLPPSVSVGASNTIWTTGQTNWTVSVFPGSNAVIATRDGYKEFRTNLTVSLGSPIEWSLPSSIRWEKEAWLAALEKAEQAVKNENWTEATNQLHAVGMMVPVSHQRRYDEVAQKVEDWRGEITKLTDLEEERRLNQRKAINLINDGTDLVASGRNGVAYIQDLLSASHRINEFLNGHEDKFENPTSLAERTDLLRASIVKIIEGEINESVDLGSIEFALRTKGSTALTATQVDQLRASIGSRQSALSRKASVEEARRLIQDYAALGPLALISERFQKLAAAAEYMEQHREDVSELMSALETHRSELLADAKGIIADRTETRREQLSLLSKAIHADGPMALDAVQYADLKRHVDASLRKIIWRFNNQTALDLVVSVGGQTLRIGSGATSDFEWTNRVTVLRDDAQVRFVSPGYATNTLALTLQPGDFARVNYSQSADVLPVPVTVTTRAASQDVERFIDNAWEPVRGNAFEIHPPCTLVMRWTRPDYEPVEKQWEVAIGHAPINLVPPTGLEWTPGPALVALRKAEDQLASGHWDVALQNVPQTSMRDADLENKRAELKRLLMARQALSTHDVEGALALAGPAVSYYPEPWKQLRAQLTSMVWKIGDPTRVSFAHNGDLAKDWRKKYEPDSHGFSNWHKKFEEFQNRAGHQEMLEGLLAIKEGGMSPQDYALALYCEMCVRSSFETPAREDRLGVSPNTFGMVGKHARLILDWLNAWEHAGASIQEETRAIVNTWSDAKARNSLLPLPEYAFQAEKIDEDPLFVFRHYQGFDLATVPRMVDAEEYKSDIRRIIERFSKITGAGMAELSRSPGDRP